MSSVVNMEVQSSDALIYAERAEHKYFLSPAHARVFVDRATEQLGQHRFRGANANTLPRPVHYVTTLYFDTQSREIAQACEHGDVNVKVRAREYYDEHPDLTELATSRADVVRHDPHVWLEVKTRTGATTRKVRFALPTREVSAFLSEGVISEATLARQRATWGESADEVFRELGELCTQTAEPLQPDCLAHYRRRAWQDPAAALRITLDTRLRFYRPPPDMFSELQSLRDAVAGPPVAQLSSYLVEIKLRSEEPQWLRRLMVEARLEPGRLGDRPFSKFLAASRAVHTPQ